MQVVFALGLCTSGLTCNYGLFVNQIHLNTNKAAKQTIVVKLALDDKSQLTLSAGGTWYIPSLTGQSVNQIWL